MSAVDWAMLGVMFAVLWLLMLSPLLVPLYLALRGGRSVPRRWLFVLLVACSGYGFLLLLFILLAYPLQFFAVAVAPQLFQDVPGTREAIGPPMEFLYEAKTWLWGPALVGYSVWFARRVWRRWPRIVSVLSSEP
jgi:hypothetical protein